MAVQLHRMAVELHRMAVLLHRVPVLLHRMAVELHRMAVLLHRTAVQLHRMAIQLHRMAVQLHRMAVRLQSNCIVWQSNFIAFIENLTILPKNKEMNMVLFGSITLACPHRSRTRRCGTRPPTWPCYLNPKVPERCAQPDVREHHHRHHQPSKYGKHETFLNIKLGKFAGPPAQSVLDPVKICFFFQIYDFL